MPSRCVAMAGTGTMTVCSPWAPSTMTRTLYEPNSMNQSCAVHIASWPSTSRATSGRARLPPRGSTAPAAPRHPSHRAPSARTVISAWPGTTPGGRITTRTGYGPALPSKKMFGLPTWPDSSIQRCEASSGCERQIAPFPSASPHLRISLDISSLHPPHPCAPADAEPRGHDPSPSGDQRDRDQSTRRSRP
jgi:hypothetical protein